VATVTAQRCKGYPVLTPVISLVEIGAGGGSIARLDPGGALAVGPESAGADPGPACYGQGGEQPTLTDANLVLGRLNPDFSWVARRGSTSLWPERALDEHVARPAGIRLHEAAQAVIANANMTSALYFISVEQGELNYPIRVARLELIPDSGGAGRFRGGLGGRRAFEFPDAACIWSVMSDGRRFALWGLAGGQPGRSAKFILDPLGEHRELPSKCAVDVSKGGRVRVETPGGGGFGAPRERDPAALERDLRDGKVTDPAASRGPAG
jgi:hypothetical protein